MAPEQLEGSRFDHRADVYALGCVLHQALTGSVPFPRDSEHAKMWAHMTEPPPRPAATAPGLPAGFDEVVARALAKRPDDRYASAGELGAAAVAAVQQVTAGAGPTSVPRPAAPPTEAASLWSPARAGSAAPTSTPPGVGPTYRPGGGAPPGRPDPWAGPAGGPPWYGPGAPQPFPGAPPTHVGSSGGFGAPSHPSAPLPGHRWAGGPPPHVPVAHGSSASPRSRNNGTVLALVLAGVILLAGVAVVALLLLPQGGRGGGTTVPTTLAARPAGAVSGAPIAVGREPRDIESGEGFVWTANTDGTISKIDPGTGTAEQISVGGVPAELVVAQGGVWVWNYSDAVTPVDIATGEVGDPVSANGTGNITGTAVGGGYLWLSHSSSNSVSRIDLTTKQPTGTPTTVGAAPVGMAFGDRLLYVSNSGEKTISVLDGSTGAVRGDPIVLTEEPAGIAVKERTIFVGTTGDVTPIDEGSSVVGDPIPLKGGSYFLADSGGIWVSFPLDDQLRWFDLKGQETRGTPVVGVGKGVGDLVLHDGGVWISDTANNTVVHVRVGG
jgi:serine/threonine-protein kinase